MRFPTTLNAPHDTQELVSPNEHQRGGGPLAGGHRKTSALLWSVQGLLALIFLAAGASKLVMSSAETLTQDLDLPVLFLRFIGVMEVLGAAGLILPALTRIRPGLTALAAAGLVIIMLGATSITAAVNGIAPALFPLVVGLLAAWVVYGRLRLAPRRAR